MKIFMTGGTGSVGPAAVRRLLEHGHDVLVVGRSKEADVGAASYASCRLEDYERLARLMAGYEAVVHLAAHASPMGKPGREVFEVNALGTWNVYEAAAANGIKRVVSASSINALGYFFGKISFPIEYLPVDEAHPVLATDAYSFSKQASENIGRYFWNREGISGTCLRLPHVWVSDATDYDARRKSYLEQRRYAEKLLELPDAELTPELQRLHDGFDRLRRDGFLESFRDHREMGEQGLSDREVQLMVSKTNFWTNVDDRDSAQSIETSVTGAYDGCHEMFINYHRNSIGLPVAELARLFYPQTPKLRPMREGSTCLVSIDRARRLIGFEPEHEV